MNTPVSIGLLALPESTPMALYGLFEVFAAVGVVWEELTGAQASTRRMAPQIISRTGEPYPSPLGLAITPHASIGDEDHLAIVIVTDLALAPDAGDIGPWTEEAAWLRNLYRAGATVCSVCTGAVFLAETGLLDGLDATTHWASTRIFAERYPAVRLHPQRILCPAGPDHRIVTAGGSASWTDLALYLIASFSGEAEARRIAKVFLLGDRGEGQLPFAAMIRSRKHDDQVVGACQQWVAEHYDERNPVAQMMQKSGLSERTFKRRFKAATGYAPLDYVQMLRIEEAKQMLEKDGISTDQAAHEVGYEDPAFFRHLFKRMTGVTPARYRERYRRIGSLLP